jgi:hypothetical protein
MSKVRYYDNVYSNPNDLILHFLSDVLEEMSMDFETVQVTIRKNDNEAVVMDKHDNVFYIRWIEGNIDDDDMILIDYSVFYEEPSEDRQII